MKIAISGKSGCGNTSVSGIVADKLGFSMINYTFRSMAEEASMPFIEFCALAENDNSYDIQLDKAQVAMASLGDCVLGSRLAIWMLEDADLKVYIYADPEIRARRIHRREKKPVETILQETLDRDARDSARYKRIYGIDTNDYLFADLIVNTNELDQFQVAAKIIEKAEETAKTIQTSGK
ncbi:MAG: cytidylate kinase family protein [Spirochaetales bacterium]|nr:cytidylate kinase family protein [Spirochaetales bacterium]